MKTRLLRCVVLLAAGLGACAAPSPAGAAARKPAASATLQEVEALLAAGRPDQALERAEAALRRERDPQLRARLELACGRAQQADGRLRSASLAYARALEALPEPRGDLAREALQAQGDVNCALLRWDAAADAYAQALECGEPSTRERDDLLYAAHVAAREAGDAGQASRWKGRIRLFSAKRLAAVEARLLPPAREPLPPPVAAAPALVPGSIPERLELLLPGLHGRAEWGAAPVRANVDPMLPIDHVTVHHTAMPSNATWPKAVGSEIRDIQSMHQGTRGWADLGYHILIDAGGGVWEGRPLRFQGAHEGAGLNRGAIGVCLLGNFDEQPLPAAQREALVRVLDALSRHFALGRADIRTHGEVRKDPTNCPGEALQAFLDGYRRSLPAASLARQ
jgi:hypothetical protein